MSDHPRSAEQRRLNEDANRTHNWKRWGPYLAERQWGTVREDYSSDGNCWDYFTHDMARSRCYRWGEDGILGITDREGRLCFSLAMWNGRDPILKERLFGLTNHQGNHGEDVKEEYFYVDSTPTHSYLKGIYKYPQAEFPYQRLVDENARRTRDDPEFELADTGIFDQNRYFDITAEYAKSGPDDIRIKITAANRGPEAATLHLLPQLYFRNAWAWGCRHEGCDVKPGMTLVSPGVVRCDHATLGRMFLYADGFNNRPADLLFTENESNLAKLFPGAENNYHNVRDAFHDFVVDKRDDAINRANVGTKVAARYVLEIPAGASVTFRLRLGAGEQPVANPFADFDQVFSQRIKEADEFYDQVIPSDLTPAERQISRQAYAGLLWSKQFYHYIVADWLAGDANQPPPAPGHKTGRNAGWNHLYSRDVMSMPDNWEYPWFAAWDLGFHTVCLAQIDPQFAKEQLLLLMREWYMHPNGHLPAYEFNFSDVNPPVHAWACWRVYKISAPKGHRDRAFLERAFHKLLLSFTWWVNRKDIEGRNLFGGGFLGLDNIGIFDRGKPLPNGGTLEQADGTAWMAFFCGTMLSIALELAGEDPVYEDIASKFFEHFAAIVNAINTLGGTGLWNEDDGFYYDRVLLPDRAMPIRVRSAVSLIPLIACEILDDEVIDKLPGFKKRLDWFLANRKDLARFISYAERKGQHGGRRLLAVPAREKLERVLRYMLDEKEFLSPYGLRSLSRIHEYQPCVIQYDGHTLQVHYEPGESRSDIFGGNSNWRGPVWFPLNYLLIEALERYHYYYGPTFTVELPTGSGNFVTLQEVAREISRRLVALFVPDASGKRPYESPNRPFATRPEWRDLVLFYEFFHGDTGQGLGASHQTGWTALAVRLLKYRVTSIHTPD